jgi:2-phosphosulfolactate phosphatase
MKIKVLHGLEGAKKAKGLTVIVDIYRAATVAAYALGHGAKYIIPVTTKEQAFTLKKKNPHYLLMGEELGIKIEGFDFGNSPLAITKADIKGKILVQRTSAGTQGLVQTQYAEEVIFGSFPITKAIAKYIQNKKPKTVSIVAMDGKESEDEFFANFLKKTIRDQQPDPKVIKQFILNHPRSTRFLDPKKPEFPEEDAHLALTIDCFDFICKLVKTNSGHRLEKYIMKRR